MGKYFLSAVVSERSSRWGRNSGLISEDSLGSGTWGLSLGNCDTFPDSGEGPEEANGDTEYVSFKVFHVEGSWWVHHTMKKRTSRGAPTTDTTLPLASMIGKWFWRTEGLGASAWRSNREALASTVMFNEAEEGLQTSLKQSWRRNKHMIWVLSEGSPSFT